MSGATVCTAGAKRCSAGNRCAGAAAARRRAHVQLRARDVPLLRAALHAPALHDGHAVPAQLQRERQEQPERAAAHRHVAVELARQPPVPHAHHRRRALLRRRAQRLRRRVLGGRGTAGWSL